MSEYQKYFIDLNEVKNNNFFLNHLEPQNLCPFAAHVLYPYFFSFQKGSWFRWSKFKNSVIAQCPNPNGGVAFQIIENQSGSILARVLSLKGKCLAGHKAGDIFELSEVQVGPAKDNCCQLNQTNNLSVSVVSHSKLCRYYQKPGRIVAKENLVPVGFCLPAYCAVYPSALSLLYDGDNFETLGKEKAADICCPNCQDYAKIQIRTKRNFFSSILNLLEKILRFVGWPKDVLDKSIDIEVTDLKGHCLKNLKPGQLFKFNLYNDQELCPAVFYTLFPFWAMLSNKFLPYWTKDEKEIDIQCPDAGANIIYRISIINN